MKTKLLLFLFIGMCFSATAQNWQWAIQENVKKFAVDPVGNVFTQNDLFIKKFDAAGTFLWQKQLNGDLVVASMIADNSGNMYLAGSFTQFSVGTNTFTSLGDRDVFLGKFSSSGQLLWNKIIGGPNTELAGDLYLDQHQKLLLCGRIGAWGSIENSIFSAPKLFVNRYDTNGTLELLIAHSGGASWEVSADTSGNIYLLGLINIGDTLDLGNGVILYGAPPNDEMGTHFMAKFNSSGIAQWAKNMGSNYYTPYEHLAVDHSGNFYLSKWERYSGFDVYKFSTAGNMIWDRDIDGLYGDCSSLCIDNNDSIWFTGYVELGPNFSFIWEYDTNNNLKRKIDPTVTAIGDMIFADQSNNVYVCGTFQDTIIFGNTTLLAPGGGFFLAKMNRGTSSATYVNAVSEDPSSLHIFPNPSNGIFTIDCNGSTFVSSIRVYDAFGNVVLATTSPTGRSEIDLGVHSKGIYFVELTTGSKTVTQKIVLE